MAMPQLTEQQLKAASALARGLSQGRAAEVAGVNRRTVVRWLKEDPFFRSEIERLSAEVEDIRVEVVEKIIENEEVSLKDLLPKALKVVKEILDNPDSRSADKIRAASLVADWAGVRIAAQTNLLGANDSPFSLENSQVDGDGQDDYSQMSDEELRRLYFDTLADRNK